jgi:rubredoxin
MATFILTHSLRSIFSAMAETATAYKTWMCLICGWIYDEAAGIPDEGIAPGTRWEDVPINWTCPECGARKEDFELVEI